MPKNLTLAVEDDVLDAARIVAAQRRTSVNALVRDFLKDLTSGDERREAARRQLLDLADNSSARIGRNFEWNRDDLYEERMLPRHQRSDLRGGREG